MSHLYPESQPGHRFFDPREEAEKPYKAKLRKGGMFKWYVSHANGENGFLLAREADQFASDLNAAFNSGLLRGIEIQRERDGAHRIPHLDMEKRPTYVQYERCKACVDGIMPDRRRCLICGGSGVDMKRPVSLAGVEQEEKGKGGLGDAAADSGPGSARVPSSEASDPAAPASLIPIAPALVTDLLIEVGEWVRQHGDAVKAPCASGDPAWDDLEERFTRNFK